MPESAFLNANKTHEAISHTYPVSLKKHSSTGDQDEFGLKDQHLSKFTDIYGRQMKLPDISHLSASSDIPDVI